MSVRGVARFTGLSERALARRNVLGLTQDEVAARMNVNRAFVSHVETGRSKNIQAATAVILARALETTVEYLVTGETK